MLAEAPCHGSTTCRIFIDVLSEIILAEYFHLFSFNGKVGAEYPSGNLPAVSTVA